MLLMFYYYLMDSFKSYPLLQLSTYINNVYIYIIIHDSHGGRVKNVPKNCGAGGG